MSLFALRNLRAAAAALCLTATSLAYAWPDKIIKIVVPAPAGGVIDVIGRLYGEFLANETGQPVIVENKPGAGGSIGVQAMLLAPADGHTILMTNSNVLAETPHVVKPPYDPMKDVKPLAVLARYPAILVVSPELPAGDMASLAKFLNTERDKVSFASPSAGTLAHYGGELLNRRLGIEMPHVPYSGSPAALVGVMSGQVTMYFDSPVTAGPLVRAGKVKPLGIAGQSRSAAFPQVPTFAEQGYPEFTGFVNWLGLAMSPKVPKSVAEKLFATTRKIAANAQFGARIAEIGLEPVVPESAEQFSRILTDDYARNAEFVRRLGIKP